MKVYQEIWEKRCYDVLTREPDFIVDAGAHIGLAATFFAQKHPRARIFCIEPDASNFAILQKNVCRFPNIRLFRGALWKERAMLKISNPSASPWAFRLETGGGIVGITVEDILQMTGRSRIDVLKMDIEGAEMEVLSASASWMQKVDTLLVELHDRFKPGCTEALMAATRDYPFTWRRSGEYTVLQPAWSDSAK